jgi:hypothetical protein
MPLWPEFLNNVVLGNSLADWLWAALVFALTFTVLPLRRGFVGRTTRRLADAQIAFAQPTRRMAP